MQVCAPNFRRFSVGSPHRGAGRAVALGAVDSITYSSSTSYLMSHIQYFAWSSISMCWSYCGLTTRLRAIEKCLVCIHRILWWYKMLMMSFCNNNFTASHSIVFILFYYVFKLHLIICLKCFLVDRHEYLKTTLSLAIVQRPLTE